MTSEFDENVDPAEETAVEAASDETSADETVADDAATESTDDQADVQDADDEEIDPLKEFRDRLWSQPGDWYVIHTYAGMEKRVQQNLENRKGAPNAAEYIHEIVVPTEEVAEIKNGQRKLVRRTVLPGYVLVRMDLTDDSWGVVRHTPSVTGFVHGAQPIDG